MAKKAAKAAAEAAPKKLTQKEAVKQIAKLHPKAKPRELAPLLKEKFGIELDPQRISMYRVILKKESGKPVGKGASGSKKASRGGDITVAELIAVKETINKLGGEARVQQVLSALKTLA
jgi:hypothetical protein